jgi:hypothetical protein
MANAITVPEREFADGLMRMLSLRDVDCRKGPTRVLLARARRLTRDLGSDLSEAQQELVKRASVLATLLEHFEARLLLGERVSVSEYVELLNAQRRIIAMLGIRRQPRDITPSLADILAEHETTL